MPQREHDCSHHRHQEPRHQEQGEPEGESASAAPKTFLGKIRGMMRRNRHGHGYSGSFQYLTKALKLDDAGLLAQLAEHGLKMAEDPAGKPEFHEENEFLYWLQKNQRGEIWINCRKGRKNEDSGSRAEEAGSKTENGGRQTEESASPSASVADSEAAASTPSEAPGSEAPLKPSTVPSSNSLPAENILSAVRLLMQPKKRGEGVTVPLTELAEKLEKTPDTIQGMLANIGLQLPDSPKAKPTFAEHGGEIYWLNASAKGQIWLNAKAASAAKKGKSKKSEDAGEE